MCRYSRAYKEGRKQSLARGESDAAARVAGAVALKATGVAWDRKCAVSKAYEEGRKQSLARGDGYAAAKVAGAVALKAAGVAWDAAHA